MTIDTVFPSAKTAQQDANKKPSQSHFSQLPLALQVKLPGDDGGEINAFVWLAGHRTSYATDFGFIESPNQVSARLKATWAELAVLARKTPLIVLPRTSLLRTGTTDSHSIFSPALLQRKAAITLGENWKCCYEEPGKIIFYHTEQVRHVASVPELSDQHTQAVSFHVACGKATDISRNVLILNSDFPSDMTDLEMASYFTSVKTKILALPNLNYSSVLFFGHGGFFPIVGHADRLMPCLQYTSVKPAEPEQASQCYGSPLYAKAMTVFKDADRRLHLRASGGAATLSVFNRATAKPYAPAELALPAHSPQQQEIHLPLLEAEDELPQNLLALLDLTMLTRIYLGTKSANPALFSTEQRANLVASFIQEFNSFGLDVHSAYSSNGSISLAFTRCPSSSLAQLYNELKTKEFSLSEQAAAGTSTSEKVFLVRNGILSVNPAYGNNPTALTDLLTTAMREIRYVLAFKVLYNAKKAGGVKLKVFSGHNFCDSLTAEMTFTEQYEKIAAHTLVKPKLAALNTSAEVWAMIIRCDGYIASTTDEAVRSTLDEQSIPANQFPLLTAPPSVQALVTQSARPAVTA